MRLSWSGRVIQRGGSVGGGIVGELTNGIISPLGYQLKDYPEDISLIIAPAVQA